MSATLRRFSVENHDGGVTRDPSLVGEGGLDSGLSDILEAVETAASNDELCRVAIYEIGLHDIKGTTLGSARAVTTDLSPLLSC